MKPMNVVAKDVFENAKGYARSATKSLSEYQIDGTTALTYGLLTALGLSALASQGCYTNRKGEGKFTALPWNWGSDRSQKDGADTKDVKKEDKKADKKHKDEKKADKNVPKTAAVKTEQKTEKAPYVFPETSTWKKEATDLDKYAIDKALGKAAKVAVDNYSNADKSAKPQALFPGEAYVPEIETFVEESPKGKFKRALRTELQTLKDKGVIGDYKENVKFNGVMIPFLVNVYDSEFGVQVIADDEATLKKLVDSRLGRYSIGIFSNMNLPDLGEALKQQDTLNIVNKANLVKALTDSVAKGFLENGDGYNVRVGDDNTVIPVKQQTLVDILGQYGKESERVKVLNKYFKDRQEYLRQKVPAK